MYEERSVRNGGIREECKADVSEMSKIKKERSDGLGM